MRDISRLLKASIQYSLDHRDDALTYALQYARDMDKSLADKFVGMYVNEWTSDYGPRGPRSGTAIFAPRLIRPGSFRRQWLSSSSNELPGASVYEPTASDR